jgi:hypothetical protein
MFLLVNFFLNPTDTTNAIFDYFETPGFKIFGNYAPPSVPHNHNGGLNVPITPNVVLIPS